MPKRIVAQTVVIVRDGQRITPEVGKPFDFSADELKQIEAINPDAIAKILEGTSEGKLVTMTEAELNAQRDKDIADALAKFKAEQGIKDDPETTNTGSGNGGADKTGKTSDKSGAKSGKSDKPSDDDI